MIAGEIGERRRQFTNTSRQEGKIWKNLWGMRIKHKLKIFIWSCLHQILPVNAAISQRTRKGEPICRCCGEEVETVEHALLLCKHAQVIWKFSSVQWDGIDEHRSDFWSWWEGVWKAKERKDDYKHIELSVYIMWQIWKDRNMINFNEEHCELYEVVNKAVQEWQEFAQSNQETKELNKKEIGRNNQLPAEQIEDPSIIRLDVSVQLDKIKKTVAYSIVAKDNEDQIKMVWAAMERREGELAIEEANTIKLALILARQRRWQKIKVQGNNKHLLQKLGSKDLNDAKCATIIENILDISVLFCDCSFQYLDCKANVLAIKVAKFAEKLKKPILWEDSFPKWITVSTN